VNQTRQASAEVARTAEDLRGLVAAFENLILTCTGGGPPATTPATDSFSQTG
jgi:hypothetical protein